MFGEIGADIGSVCLVDLLLVSCDRFNELVAVCERFNVGTADDDVAWLRFRPCPCDDDCAWCDDKFKPIGDGAVLLDGRTPPKLVGKTDGCGIDIGDKCGEWLN